MKFKKGILSIIFAGIGRVSILGILKRLLVVKMAGVLFLGVALVLMRLRRIANVDMNLQRKIRT
jgi:hypothetical protein